MSIHVFDTFAQKKNGETIHFDVLMPDKDQSLAEQYARQWLIQIGEHDAVIKPSGCLFCHSRLDMPEYSDEIEQKGFAIYKLEGCPV